MRTISLPDAAGEPREHSSSHAAPACSAHPPGPAPPACTALLGRLLGPEENSLKWHLGAGAQTPGSEISLPGVPGIASRASPAALPQSTPAGLGLPQPAYLSRPQTAGPVASVTVAFTF